MLQDLHFCQELFLPLGVLVQIRERILDLCADIFCRILRSQELNRRSDPHHIVRMVKHLCRVIQITLEAQQQVVVRPVSFSLQGVRVPVLLRFEICRPARNFRRQLRYLFVCDAHGAHGSSQAVLHFGFLEVRRIVFDEADLLKSVGHQKIVDGFIEFVVDLLIDLHSVFHDDPIHLVCDFISLYVARICLCQTQQIPIAQVVLFCNLTLRNAIYQLSGSLCNRALLALGQLSNFLFHSFSFQDTLRHVPFVVRQLSALSGLIREASCFVHVLSGFVPFVREALRSTQHPVFKSGHLVSVDPHRANVEVKDLFSLIYTKDLFEHSLRRSLVHDQLGVVFQLASQLRTVAVFVRQQIFGDLVVRLIDFRASLIQHIIIKGFLCHKVVGQFCYAFDVDRPPVDLISGQRSVRHHFGKLDFRFGGMHLFDPLVQQSFRLSGSLFIAAQHIRCPISGYAAIDLDAQLVHSRCGLEVLFFYNQIPLLPVRLLLLLGFPRGIELFIFFVRQFRIPVQIFPVSALLPCSFFHSVRKDLCAAFQRTSGRISHALCKLFRRHAVPHNILDPLSGRSTSGSLLVGQFLFDHLLRHKLIDNKLPFFVCLLNSFRIEVSLRFVLPICLCSRSFCLFPVHAVGILGQFLFQQFQDLPFRPFVELVGLFTHCPLQRDFHFPDLFCLFVQLHQLICRMRHGRG